MTRQSKAVSKAPLLGGAAKRRRFDAQYKTRILAEADSCPPGEIGALLRREGLYSSNLTTWRRQRDEGALAALQPKRAGPKARGASPEARRITQLERENQRLHHRLKQAEMIIEFQRKMHEVMGKSLETLPEDDGPPGD